MWVAVLSAVGSLGWKISLRLILNRSEGCQNHSTTVSLPGIVEACAQIACAGEEILGLSWMDSHHLNRLSWHKSVRGTCQFSETSHMIRGYWLCEVCFLIEPTPVGLVQWSHEVAQALVPVFLCMVKFPWTMATVAGQASDLISRMLTRAI